MMKHYDTECFWCKKKMEQRCDTYNRQLKNYGHQCCKRCFGNEPTFKEARKRTMLENNPFKGKHHAKECKLNLSKGKVGCSPWNKGFTVNTHPSVAKYVKTSKQSGVFRNKTGSANPNWKGGVSYNNGNRIKFSRRWGKFRLTILKREGNTCYKCSIKFPNNQIEIHHLMSRKRNPEYEYDPYNCATLCKSCHKKFHSEFGIKNFTPADFKMFINNGRNPENYFKWD